MKLFKSYSEKEVKRVMPLVNKINGFKQNKWLRTRNGKTF